MLTLKAVCSGGVLEQLVEHRLGPGVALELDHQAHALAVGLVAHVGDAVQRFSRDQLGDLLLQGGLVHLVGQLGDDDLARSVSRSLSSISARARIMTRPRPVA